MTGTPIPPERLAAYSPEQLEAYRAGYEDGFHDREHDEARIDQDWQREKRATFAPRTPAHSTADVPPQVLVHQALASWGIEPPATEQEGTPDPESVSGVLTEEEIQERLRTASTDLGSSALDLLEDRLRRSNRRLRDAAQQQTRTTPDTSRGNIMSTRTITGNLATDPEVVDAGRVRITKLRVIENTGEYRQGTWHPHPNPTTHFVEAKFDAGENAAASLHKGDPVIVVGREHTIRWGEQEARQYGRVIQADTIGVDLGRATAAVTR